MKGLRVGGVPLHPLLVHFPVAAWALAACTDVLFFFTGKAECWTLTYWALAAGALLGLLAMCGGLVDFMLLDPSHPGAEKVQTHMLVMGSVWCVFLLDLLVRKSPVPAAVVWWQPALTVLGFLLLVVGGHLGARLVYHHGVNVENNP